MTLTLKSASGGIVPETYDFFESDDFDAFHTEPVLRVVNGDDWLSVLITDGTNAFFHVQVRSPIPGSPFYDVEPLLGYAGPLATTDDPDFLGASMERLSEFSRRQRIVAEIVRFNPLLKNHHRFDNITPALRVTMAKQIVILNCFEDEQRQLAEFTSSRRRDIRKKQDQHHVVLLEGEEAVDQFERFYRGSLRAAGADMKWFLKREVFRRAARCDEFALYANMNGSSPGSAILAVHHPTASYALLAANAEDVVPGSMKYLVFRVAVESARRGSPYLFLGGGNTSAEDDSLLLWKAKFSSKPRPFFIGMWIHDHSSFADLCARAVAMDSRLESSPLLLKYRALH